MIEPLPVHLRDCAEAPGHIWDQPDPTCMCSCHQVPFTFTVPGQPPTTNHMYSRSKGGSYKAEGVEDYQTVAAYITRQARPKGWTPGRRIHIDLTFWMSRGGRDADNHLKALLDAIAIALGVNDSSFLPCVAANETDKDNPRVEVVIRNGS